MRASHLPVVLLACLAVDALAEPPGAPRILVVPTMQANPSDDDATAAAAACTVAVQTLPSAQVVCLPMFPMESLNLRLKAAGGPDSVAYCRDRPCVALFAGIQRASYVVEVTGHPRGLEWQVDLALLAARGMGPLKKETVAIKDFNDTRALSAGLRRLMTGAPTVEPAAEPPATLTGKTLEGALTQVGVRFPDGSRNAGGGNLRGMRLSPRVSAEGKFTVDWAPENAREVSLMLESPTGKRWYLGDGTWKEPPTREVPRDTQQSVKTPITLTLPKREAGLWKLTVAHASASGASIGYGYLMDGADETLALVGLPTSLKVGEMRTLVVGIARGSQDRKVDVEVSVTRAGGAGWQNPVMQGAALSDRVVDVDTVRCDAPGPLQVEAVMRISGQGVLATDKRVVECRDSTPGDVKARAPATPANGGDEVVVVEWKGGPEANINLHTLLVELQRVGGPRVQWMAVDEVKEGCTVTHHLSFQMGRLGSITLLNGTLLGLKTGTKEAAMSNKCANNIPASDVAAQAWKMLENTTVPRQAKLPDGMSLGTCK